MGRQSSAKRQRRQGTPSSTDKGRLVEQIVAGMHQVAGVTVERNVFLPVVGGDRRKREIDVLITSAVAGYPVRFAIECKNESEATGAPHIDAFVGKLADVNIPTQYGIYVSTSRYTTDAIARANYAGIRTLLLTGLSDDRLQSAIFEAIQSVVHCLLTVIDWQIFNHVDRAMSNDETMLLFDADGSLCGTIPDLIWHKWMTGEPPSVLGEYPLRLDIPEGWHQVVDGKPEPIVQAGVRVSVVGLVLKLGGQVTQHSLVRPSDAEVEKLRVQAQFAFPEGKHTLAIARSEEELAALVTAPNTAFTATTKIRLPRIRMDAMYWPPSERVTRKVEALMAAYLAGEGPDPRPLDFADLEGTDLSTVFEPIWSGHRAGQVSPSGTEPIRGMP